MEAKTSGADADFYFSGREAQHVLYTYTCMIKVYAESAGHTTESARVFYIYVYIHIQYHMCTHRYLRRHWRARRPGVKPHSVELSPDARVRRTFFNFFFPNFSTRLQRRRCCRYSTGNDDVSTELSAVGIIVFDAIISFSNE